MSRRLDGKIALVTGGSRGIGKGIALRLAEDGALVVVHYGVNREAAEEVVRSIEGQGGQAAAIGAKLESLDGVEKLVHALQEELVRITGDHKFDILVNNAGIGTSASLEETTEESFDEIFAVNVKAPFFLVQKLLPLLRDEGRVINISSGVTRIAFPKIMAYNMTKGALNTFTLHLAQMLGARGITVNAVMPGFVDTDVNASWLHTPEGQQMASEASAFGRVGQPDDIADVVAFLSSTEGRWITGQMVDATGGAHL